jgi:cysteine synthase B
MRPLEKKLLNKWVAKKIDVLVAGVGTGGTITGVGKRLKEKYPDVKIVGVFPRPKTKIQGLKSIEEGYIPPILDLKIIDEKIIVKDREAFEMTKKLAQKEGIFAGLSSGADFVCSS